MSQHYGEKKKKFAYHEWDATVKNTMKYVHNIIFNIILAIYYFKTIKYFYFIILYFQDSLLSQQTICNNTSVTDDDKVQYSTPHVKNADATYIIGIEKGKSRKIDSFFKICNIKY